MMTINTQKPNGLIKACDKLAKFSYIFGLIVFAILLPNLFSATPMFEFQAALVLLSFGTTIFALKKWLQVIFNFYSKHPRHINFSFALTYTFLSTMVGILCSMSFQTPNAIGIFFGQDMLNYYSFASIALLTALFIITPIMYLYSQNLLKKS